MAFSPDVRNLERLMATIVPVGFCLQIGVADASPVIAGLDPAIHK
jgi:hypothetical protein